MTAHNSDGYYAFKVLCSCEVIDEVIGIANDTTNVTFSKEEALFPKSKLRMVVCRSYCSEDLFNLILALMKRILERAVYDRQNKNESDHFDYRGNCIFYAAVSDRMAYSLIGSGGSNVKRIKEEFGMEVADPRPNGFSPGLKFESGTLFLIKSSDFHHNHCPCHLGPR